MIYQPDAPESVKHWSGRDPSGEPDSERCADCHRCHDECECEPEANPLDGETGGFPADEVDY